jgi:tetratricopeptide (TPR) repeat protein
VSRAAELAELQRATTTGAYRIDPQALDRIIDELRATADGPDRAFTLHKLAIALRARHQRTQAAADAEEALAVLRTAVDLTPETDPWLPEYLTHLAAALVQAHVADDIDQAVAAAERALALTPEGHPQYAKRLSVVASAMRQAAVARRDPSRLGEIVDLHARAVRATHPADPRRSRQLFDLALTLSARYETNHRRDDLESALRLLREAVDTAHPYDEFVATAANTRRMLVAMRRQR